jgi:hypothetical protein
LKEPIETKSSFSSWVSLSDKDSADSEFKKYGKGPPEHFFIDKG